MIPRWYLKTAQLAIYIIGFLYMYLEHIKGSPDTTLNGVFYIFTVLIVTDSIIAVFEGKFHDDSENKILTEHIDMYRRSDIVTPFSDALEGLRYCIDTCSEANEVSNTVFRYNRPPMEGGLYNEWLQAKRKSLTRKNPCAWRELLSSHLGPNDRAMSIVEDFKSNNNYKSPHYIDDINLPVIQMTIFSFPKDGRHKEVVFGWELPGNERGSCFLTRNELVVEYFENYFDYLYNMKDEHSFSKLVPHQTKITMTATDPSQPTDIRLIGSEKQFEELTMKIVDTARMYTQSTKYDIAKGSLAGIWLYKLRGNSLKNVCGKLTIRHTESYLIVSADVWYHPSGKRRGKWYSRDVSYNSREKTLYIVYEMFVESPAVETYIGTLSLELQGDPVNTLNGKLNKIDKTIGDSRLEGKLCVKGADSTSKNLNLRREFAELLDVDFDNELEE